MIDVCGVFRPQKNINNPKIYSDISSITTSTRVIFTLSLHLCLKLNRPVQSHIYGIRCVSHCNIERIHYGAISLCNLLFPAILKILPLFSPSAVRGETAGQARISGSLNTTHAENIEFTSVSKLGKKRAHFNFLSTILVFKPDKGCFMSLSPRHVSKLKHPFV